MAKILFLFLLSAFLAMAPRASATFALVHDTHTNCASAPCTITIPSTTAGNLGILYYQDAAGSSRTVSSVSDGSSTYVVPAGCKTFDNGNSICAYSLSLSGSITSVTLTLNAAGADGNMEFIEYSHTGTISFDTAAVNTSLASGTSQSGVSLTLSGTNDVIIQSYNGNDGSRTVSAVNGSYTNPADFRSGPLNGVNYYGFAGWINTSSGTAPSWTTNNGAATPGFSSALAIKESAASGVVRRRGIVIQK